LPQFSIRQIAKLVAYDYTLYVVAYQIEELIPLFGLYPSPYAIMNLISKLKTTLFHRNRNDMPISQRVKKGLERVAFWRELPRERASLRQKYGDDQLFDLTLDNPLNEPLPEFDRELKKLIETPRAGLHRYMENAGYTDTRKAIASTLAAGTGLPFTLDEVIMTSGASGAINMALKALLNPGEEVILFSPLAFDYEAYVENHAGVVKIVPCEESFEPNLAALEASITAKTKAVLINSPNNPAGVVYSQSILQKVAGIITRQSDCFNSRIYVISDDSYRKFYYGRGKLPWILNHYPHTILVSSYSRDLPVPGERIGYTAISPLCEDAKGVVGGLIHANRTLGFVNAPAFMQNVVRGLPNYSLNLAEYTAKRDFIYLNLTQMGYSVVKPAGAFFLFPRAPVPDDYAFVNGLNNYRVLTVPGSLFHAPGYFRVSYCVDTKVLEGSLAGFRYAING
jgi:aspartate aminotransferase